MEEEQRQQMFQAPSQFDRDFRAKKSSGFKKYLIILISIIILGLLIFGILRFFGVSSSNSESEALTPTPTLEEIPTDSPTPAEETPAPTESAVETPTGTPKPSTNPVDKSSGIDRSQLSIHILNGSGITGASKKASEYLEGLGYNIVQIGNADNFDYTDTEIQIKSSFSKYLSLLKGDLSKNYTVGNTSDAPPSDESADAIVIIGQN